MSDEETSESEMELEIELPPALVQLVAMVRDEQMKLRKDKAFDNPVHLRKFVALNLMERVVQIVEMLGTTMYDTHQLALSNAMQLQRMRKWTGKHLRKLGADVSDGDPFGGADVQGQINAFGQAFYALGSHLQAKYPNDKDTEITFNNLAMSFNNLVAALMGDQSVEDDVDDDSEPDEPESGAESGQAENAGDEADGEPA